VSSSLRLGIWGLGLTQTGVLPLQCLMVKLFTARSATRSHCVTKSAAGGAAAAAMQGEEAAAATLQQLVGQRDRRRLWDLLRSLATGGAAEAALHKSLCKSKTGAGRGCMARHAQQARTRQAAHGGNREPLRRIHIIRRHGRVQRVLRQRRRGAAHKHSAAIPSF
jgi:hypothetical protein